MKYNKLINRFNEPDVHLVVSAWPEATKTGEVNHGIAWYTKLMLTALAKNHGARFVVLAERGLDNRPKLVARGRILILRVFDRTHSSLYPTILTWLARLWRVTRVTVHSEFGVGTGLVHYLLLLPFLVLIKLAGRRLTYFAHNVVTDVSFLKSHLNLPDNPYLIDGLNVLVTIHTRLLGWMADRFVVLDQALAQRAAAVVRKDKLALSPLPVPPTRATISKARARHLLGLGQRVPIVLAFGFVSAYKGTDWIINAFANLARQKNHTPAMLVVAGGPAHSLGGKPHYRRFYEIISKVSDETPGIRLTGFVPEKAIAAYFAAADLVVLPYRGVMGASGALSHALVYGKPVLLSAAMTQFWKNDDVKAAARQAKLLKTDLFFPMDERGIQRIITIARSEKKLKKLAAWSRNLAQKRSVETIATDQYNELYRFTPTHETATIQGMAYIGR